MDKKLISFFLFIVLIVVGFLAYRYSGNFILNKPKATIESISKIRPNENEAIPYGSLVGKLSYKIKLSSINESDNVHVRAYMSVDGKTIITPGGVRKLLPGNNEGEVDIWLSKLYEGKVGQTNYIIVRVERIVGDSQDLSMEILDQEVLPWKFIYSHSL